MTASGGQFQGFFKETVPLVWSEVNTLSETKEVKNLAELYKLSRLRENDCEFVNTQTGKTERASELFKRGDFYAKGLLAIGLKAGDTVAVCGLASLENVALLIGATIIGVGYAHPLVTRVGTSQLISTLAPQILVVGEGKNGQTYDNISRIMDEEGNNEHVLGPGLPSIKQIFYDDTYRARQHSGRSGIQSLKKLLELGQNVPDTKLEAAIESVQPNHPSLHLFTSGTTGTPKCVVYSQQGVASDTMRFSSKKPLGPVVVLSCDVGELSYMAVMGSLFGGIKKIVTVRDAIGYKDDLEEYARHVKDTLQTEKIEHSALTMETMKMLLALVRKEGHTFPDLKTAAVGGQIVSPQMKVEIIQYLNAIPWTVFGMSEISFSALTSPVGHSEKIETGRMEGRLRAKHNSWVKIVDDKGNVVKIGEEGELMFKHHNILMYYKNNPQATKELITEDGFARTGDIAHMYDDGTFVIVGRKSDAIRFKVLGKTVYPGPIEESISEHPSIKDIAVVSGTRNDWIGDETSYCIVLHDGEPPVTEERLIQMLETKSFGERTRPARILYFDQLPRTANLRKVSRSGLREAVKNRPADEGYTKWYTKLTLSQWHE